MSAVAGNQFFKGTLNNASQLPALEAGVANIASNLAVNGNETIAGNLAVNGTTTSTGLLTASGNAQVGGNLAVAGTTTSTGLLTASTDAQVGGNLAVAGSLTVVGAVVGAAVIGTGTLNTSGAAVTITAAQLLGGYTYTGALAAGVALNLPTGVDLQAALLAVGVTSAAGTRLVNPISINVSGAFDLTVTGLAGATVLGGPAVQATAALVHITFTAAATYDAVVVLSA